MPENDEIELTERQRRELEYHRAHASAHQSHFVEALSWDVLDRPSRRWWNAYWQMYSYLVEFDVRNKRVLVVGCGFGDDALRLAKLGADVFAFDLSPELLSVGRQLAEREGLKIRFERMPAENLGYESDFFDCVLARDILHHVDIPRAMSEIRRVSRAGAMFVVNEIYSHSVTDRIRHSRLVERRLYPAMQKFVYGQRKPYITEDERKLTEADIAAIRASVPSWELEKYFYFFVARIVPERFETLAKLDRLLLRLLQPLGPVLAGRILFAGRMVK